jgi:hypothetical protein
MVSVCYQHLTVNDTGLMNETQLSAASALLLQHQASSSMEGCYCKRCALFCEYTLWLL